jgi:hypothetical protein
VCNAVVSALTLEELRRSPSAAPNSAREDAERVGDPRERGQRGPPGRARGPPTRAADAADRRVPTSSLLRTPRALDGAQRHRHKRELVARWFRQDPRVPADQILADDRWLQHQALAAGTRSS